MYPSERAVVKILFLVFESRFFFSHPTAFKEMLTAPHGKDNLKLTQSKVTLHCLGNVTCCRKNLKCPLFLLIRVDSSKWFSFFRTETCPCCFMRARFAPSEFFLRITAFSVRVEKFHDIVPEIWWGHVGLLNQYQYFYQSWVCFEVFVLRWSLAEIRSMATEVYYQAIRPNSLRCLQ